MLINVFVRGQMMSSTTYDAPVPYYVQHICPLLTIFPLAGSVQIIFPALKAGKPIWLLDLAAAENAKSTD